MPKHKNDESTLRNYLQYDEEILWTGKPNPKRLLKSSDVMLIPFSLFWCVVSYGMVITMVMQMGWQGLWTLFIPHVWIAAWLFPGRFIQEYFTRERTTYAVTNHRVLILNQVSGEKLESTFIDCLPQLDIHARKNNTGTIKFSGKAKHATEENRDTSTTITDFYDIPGVREVYRLLQDLQYDAQAQGDEVAYYQTKPKRYARQ